MPEVNLLETYPKAVRDVGARLRDKERNREIALRFGFEYFDGPRDQGYGGYRYDGRWVNVAKRMIDHFALRPGDSVLDVGCAKGFLVKDLADACPGLVVHGLDISYYALAHAHPDTAGRLVQADAKRLPFANHSYDVIVSINTIHNLPEDECYEALREFQRVSRRGSFVQVDAYRNEAERELFEDWMLTAKTYAKPADWERMFHKAGYTGDYYWTILELE